MPGVDGIEATRRIVDADFDGPRVLVLTTFDLDEYVYDALGAGGSGFLLKDAKAETLFEAIRVVAAGEALLAPNITRRLISEFARLRPALPPRPEALNWLTERETEVLRLVAEGLSNSEIAQHCMSRTKRSRLTSAESSPNSAYVTGPKPSCWRTRLDWSSLEHRIDDGDSC